MTQVCQAGEGDSVALLIVSQVLTKIRCSGFLNQCLSLCQVQCAHVELERRQRRLCGLCFELLAAKCTGNAREGKAGRELA